MDPAEPKSRIKRVIAVAIVLIIVFLVLPIALLIPAFHDAERHARVHQAKAEMAAIVAAISQYQAAYSRSPVSSNALIQSDFTFGTFGTSEAFLGITNDTSYQANNSEVIAMLIDLDKFPNGTSTVNEDHAGNPRMIIFLNAKMVNDTISPGIGRDYVYRDPWGHPYIITIDLNGDKKCRDAFYRLASVSETASAMGSHAYLTRPSPPPYSSDDARDSFEVPNTSVIVWSLGPDGKADKTQKANEGVNKDNVTSW